MELVAERHAAASTAYPIETRRTTPSATDDFIRIQSGATVINIGGMGERADASANVRPPWGDSVGAPVEAVVRLIRGRRKPDILIRLARGTLRFGELHRAIPGISERVLARQLDELERDGLVDRTPYAEIPPRVEYSLTPLGATLCPIIKQLWTWGVQHPPSPSG